VPRQTIYEIAPGPAPETSAEDVGNKAWNLMRMAAAGLPVPAGFVLPASWSKRLHADRVQDNVLADALTGGIARLEKLTGLSFGSSRRPLLVSVRSGSAVSMPGMMETVLDIGLNPDSVEGLLRLTGNPRLAWDCYRRLIQGYAEVVHGLPAGPFEELIAQAVSDTQMESDRDLDYRALRKLSRDMAARFHQLAGEAFPTDPREQLRRAAAAVFRSWDAPKAAAYRRLNRISDDLGTAVTVQVMVFGNAGGESGSGVAFTRNPATGEPELYLDFRFNGQGEDVVAGRQRTEDRERLRHTLPAVWRQIESTCRTLETLFGDAQDFEFTLQNGALYLLQSRDAKRSNWAALRIAVDLVREGLIEPQEALRRLSGIDLARVSRTRFETHAAEPLARAQAASIGVVSGALALDSSAAERMAKESATVILVRRDTATSDIRGIASAGGILTASGSRTSHAAVVARQLGKVCLVGCPTLQIDLSRRRCRIGRQTLNEGDFLSLDGNEGCIYSGTLNVVTERPERELKAIAQWSSQASQEGARNPQLAIASTNL
jgi:pyruvate,orthophosphate dikinase